LILAALFGHQPTYKNVRGNTDYRQKLQISFLAALKKISNAQAYAKYKDKNVAR